MKAKVTNIMHTVDAHHRVAVKMDKSCGINQLTITSGKGVLAHIQVVKSANIRAKN